MQLPVATALAQHSGGALVGGEERLDCQLGDRGVDGRPGARAGGGRPELRRGADERELLAVDAQPERYRDRAGLEVRRVARLAAGIRRERLVEREERRVAAHDRLAAEAVEQVRAPLAEVDDARRHALGMEAQAQD